MSSCIRQCDLSLSNTGTECVPVIDITDKLWFTRKYAADGTRNRIDIAALEAAVEAGTEAAFWDSMINHDDASKRWYPVGSFKNITDNREEAKYFDWEDGSKSFIRDGVRTFTGLIANAAAQLKRRIESFRNFQTAVLYITKSNQAVGKISSDRLYIDPVEVEPDSIAAIFNKRGESSTQTMGVRFDVKSTENDADLRIIDCSEVGDVTLNDYRGLLDLIVNESEITQYGFTMELTADWGTVTNPFMATGFTNQEVYSSDTSTGTFVYNETTDANVGVTVTEGEDGVYAVVFAAMQPVNSVIKYYLAKDGYGTTDTQTVTLPST